VAKVTQKTLLIDISVIPGGHFKFRLLEKMLTFLEGAWRLIFLGMVPGTTFHHQNTIYPKSGHRIGVYDYTTYNVNGFSTTGYKLVQEAYRRLSFLYFCR